MKKSIVAAMSVAVLLFTSSVASAQVCAIGLIASAIGASLRDHRELTAKEAATCGVMYLFEAPKPEKKASKPKKKIARRDKQR